MSSHSPDDKSIPLPPPEAKRSLVSSRRLGWVEEYLKFLAGRSAELELPVRVAERAPKLTLPSVYTPLYGIIGLDARSPQEGRTPLDRIVETTPAVLLVGESGTGKSTFLRHLAGQYVSSGVTVPFLLELADINVLAPGLRTLLGRLPWDTLLRCLSQHLSVIGIHASLEDVQAFTGTSGTIWLLDGLNEITDSATRKELSDVIRRDRVLWPKSKFVVTASDSVIRDGTAPVGGENGLQEVVIDRFQRDDVFAFFDSYLKALRPALGDAERRTQWEPVARRVLSVPELEDLLTSPLNLTAIALLYLTEPRDPMEKELPAIRGELLEAVIRWTLRRRSSDVVPDSIEPIDALTPLGYAMLAADPGPLTKCGIGWAVRCIGGGQAFGADQGRAEKFLRSAADSGLVLRHAGPGDLKLQESFRDYLASRHLVRRQRSQEWRSVLAAQIDNPAWRHTLHLVAGELLARGTAEVDDFFNWLADLSYTQPLEQRLKRVALGGSILRELRAGGYSLSETSVWRNLTFTIMELFRRPLPWIPLRVRYEAGVALGLAGDTRLDDFDSTWATIPGGSGWFGAQAADPASTNYDALAAPWEVPVHQFELPEYAIRVFPITVVEYAAFVAAGGYRELDDVWDPVAWGWIQSEHIQAPRDWGAQLFYPNTPVTGVSWYEGRAYCKWLSVVRADGYEYRLPREHEWEFAARRGARAGGTFPWGATPARGNDAEANWAGAGLRRKTPVGMFPRSATLDGVADMYGNVEEWCLERWVDFHKTADWTWDDLVDAKHLNELRVLRIVKGGSCIRFSRLMRPSYRSRIVAAHRYHTVGFRPVRVAQVTFVQRP